MILSKLCEQVASATLLSVFCEATTYAMQETGQNKALKV